jgi:hypothetical protein
LDINYIHQHIIKDKNDQHFILTNNGIVL